MVKSTSFLVSFLLFLAQNVAYLGLFRQATVGQDSTWLGDCLGTSGAAGVGSDIDDAWRIVLNPGMPVAGGSAFAMLVSVRLRVS